MILQRSFISNEEEKNDRATFRGIAVCNPRHPPSVVWTLLCAVTLNTIIVALLPLTRLICEYQPQNPNTCICSTFVSPLPAEITIEQNRITEAYISGFGIIELAITNIPCADYSCGLASETPPSSAVCRLAEIADPRSTAIINPGYPFRKLTNNEERDFYITQMALWLYPSESGAASEMINIDEIHGDEAHPEMSNGIIRFSSPG